MAVHENVRLLSCKVRVVNGVAAAIVDRFCVRDATAGRVDEMITLVPGATGGIPDGIIGMKPDTRPFLTSTGTVVTSYVPADGAEAIIELGEACAAGAWLRAGGSGAEADGAAYLADATGDIRVFKAAEPGVVGQKIRGNFINGGVTP
jgi:hypothetical protein